MLTRLIILILTVGLFIPQAKGAGGNANQGESEQIESNQDLTTIPFEKLVDMEITSAYKAARQISDAPSAVAIVTADDIKAYGYRSIGDIVNSMPGLFTTYDRSIYYLGGRGFGRSGDYVGRILLLIDGYATNDNIYDEAYIGNDGLVDTELIERVEYVPGTGSSIYGSNAYFGIINIITKKGSDINGTQLSVAMGSYGTTKARASFGKKLENGADMLLSASILRSDGQNFFFPEFNNAIADTNFAVNQGSAKNLDGERSPRLFAKLQFQDWSLEGGFVSRKHDNPTGAYEAQFNADTSDWDTNGFINFNLNSTLSPHLKSSTRIYYGYYLDRTSITNKAGILLQEHNKGEWLGGDLKFVGDWFENHTLVFGTEFRDDFDISFQNSFGASDHNRTNISLYAQDEILLTSKVKLNVGGRYDKPSDVSENLSPRVALIYSPTAATTIKASYSTAFRAPSPYEKYYSDPTQTSNYNLSSEYVTTTELVLQHQFANAARFSSSLYHYETSDLIVSQTLASGLNQNINSGNAHTNGIELSLQKQWDSGIRANSSYAYQHAHDEQNKDLINLPRNLAKLNLSFPFWQHALRTGVEVQYTDSRLSEQRVDVPGYMLTNLTISTEHPFHQINASLSVRNLFDKKYFAVAPADYVQKTLQMDGINAWLQLTYDVK